MKRAARSITCDVALRNQGTMRLLRGMRRIIRGRARRSTSCSSPMLTLRTYAHAMREEEADLSFAEFGTGRRQTAPEADGAASNAMRPALGKSPMCAQRSAI